MFLKSRRISITSFASIVRPVKFGNPWTFLTILGSSNDPKATSWVEEVAFGTLAGRYVGPQTLLSGSTENKKKWSKTRNILGHHIWSDQFCHALRAKPCWKSWHSSDVQSWHSHRSVCLFVQIYSHSMAYMRELGRARPEIFEGRTSFQSWLNRLWGPWGKAINGKFFDFCK